MSQMPKWLIVTGYVFTIIGCILLFPVLLVGALIFLIVTLPYTLFYFSPNFGLTSRDYQIVEVYLRHFERLHPDLMGYVAQAHSNMGQGKPPGLSFWPHKSKHSFLLIPGFFMSSSQYKFSQAAGFFARLEAIGFPRRAVWEFLRDQVEPSGLVNELEKLDFGKLVDKMTSHNLLNYSWDGSSKDPQSEKEKQEKQYKDELIEKKAVESYGHLNRPIVRVRKDSPECILHRGALLVPDRFTRNIVANLAAFPPVCQTAEKISVDASEGQPDYWQIGYVRTAWPWHEDY